MERVILSSSNVHKRHSLRFSGGVNIEDSSIFLEDNERASEIVRDVMGGLTIRYLNVSAPYFHISGNSSIHNLRLSTNVSKGRQEDSKVNVLKNVNLSNITLSNASLDSGVIIDGAGEGIYNSHIGTGSNITNSGISSSVVGSNSSIAGSIVSVSNVGSGASILRSNLVNATIFSGVTVVDSNIWGVTINTNKDDNHCTEDNVDLPEYLDVDGFIPNYCKISRSAE